MKFEHSRCGDLLNVSFECAELCSVSCDGKPLWSVFSSLLAKGCRIRSEQGGHSTVWWQSDWKATKAAAPFWWHLLGCRVSGDFD
jgi:hypothetical protein